MYRRGYTLIEILIVVAIIGILVGIIAYSLSSAQKRAVVTSYKTTMQSVRTAIEICAGTGGTLIAGTRLVGDPICAGGSETYAVPAEKCTHLSYIVTNGATESSWSVTTSGLCGGCRIVCDAEKCVAAAEAAPGECAY